MGLLVEDDDLTARFVAKGLREAGYVVELVIEGREALLKGASEPFDAAIVDVMLPGLDGLSLNSQLARNADHDACSRPQAPVTPWTTASKGFRSVATII